MISYRGSSSRSEGKELAFGALVIVVIFAAYAISTRLVGPEPARAG